LATDTASAAAAALSGRVPFFFAPEPLFLDITAPFDRPTLRRWIDQE
jgi:hypothetical protein